MTPIPYPSVSTPFRSRTEVAKYSKVDFRSPLKATPFSLKTSSATALAESKFTPSTRAISSGLTNQASSKTDSKRLSQTASAFLSLIDPVGSPAEVEQKVEEERKLLTDPAIKSFVNPYASPSVLPSPRRQRVKRETLASATKKRRAIDYVARTIPANEQNAPGYSLSLTPPSSSLFTFQSSSNPVPALTSASGVNFSQTSEISIRSVKSSTNAPEPAAAATVAVPPSTPVFSFSPIVSKPEESSNLGNFASTSELGPAPLFSFNKFKPTVSSNLRDSVVASPPRDKESKGSVQQPAPFNFSRIASVNDAETSVTATSFDSFGSATTVDDSQSNKTSEFSTKVQPISFNVNKDNVPEPKPSVNAPEISDREKALQNVIMFF